MNDTRPPSAMLHSLDREGSRLRPQDERCAVRYCWQYPDGVITPGNLTYCAQHTADLLSAFPKPAGIGALPAPDWDGAWWFNALAIAGAWLFVALAIYAALVLQAITWPMLGHLRWLLLSAVGGGY